MKVDESGVLNLRESEYNQVETMLETTHKNQLDCIEKMIVEIRRISGTPGIFETSLTSKNIVNILSTLQTDVVSLMRINFEELEKNLQNMLSVVQAYDDEYAGGGM